MQFKLDMRSKAARAAFAKAPNTFYAHMKDGFEKVGDSFAAATKKRINRPWSFRNKTNRLSSRSGDLANSIDSRVHGSGDSLRLSVTIGDSDSAKYVFIHEGNASGTPITIKPKNGKWLTIPQPDNLTAGGRVRYPSARDLMDKGSTYRKGRAIFLKRGNKRTDTDPMLWVLVKSVTIKPRLRFKSSWLNSSGIDKMRRKILQDAVTEAVKAIQGRGV